jgi:small subunit ribosomal protein S5
MPGQNQQRRDQPRRDRRPLDPDEKQFDEQVVHIDRVARVVKGGRRFHFRALVAVGDHAGNIGIGVSKGVDVTSAVAKSVSVAKKNMTVINLYNETIPHEAEAKVGGAHVLIKPAAPGTGLKAGGVIRIVLDVAGVKNVLSKSLGSSNKINNAYATLTALKLIEPQANWVTKQVYTKNESTKPVVESSVEEKEIKTEKTKEKTETVEKEANTEETAKTKVEKVAKAKVVKAKPAAKAAKPKVTKKEAK